MTTYAFVLRKLLETVPHSKEDVKCKKMKCMGSWKWAFHMRHERKAQDESQLAPGEVSAVDLMYWTEWKLLSVTDKHTLGCKFPKIQLEMA